MGVTLSIPVIVFEGEDMKMGGSHTAISRIVVHTTLLVRTCIERVGLTGTAERTVGYIESLSDSLNFLDLSHLIRPLPS